jgi:hypothetical protein
MKISKIISLASLFALVAVAAEANVTVRSVSDNSATLTQDGQVSPLTVGQMLTSGLVQTNTATVMLVMPNDSVLTFGPDSAFQVGSLSGPAPVLELLSGSVSGSAVGQLSVVTSAGEASVANGSFAVSTDGQSIQVSNATASVNVTPAGAAPVSVPAGQATSANQSGVVSVSSLSSSQVATIVGSGQAPVVSTPTVPLPPALEDTLIDVEVASDKG